MTPAAADLQHWLLTEGRTPHSMEVLLTRFAERLAALVPVARIWAGTRVLHPQAAAWLWIWEGDQPVFHHQLSYTRFAELRQTDTLARRLELGAESVRLQLDSPDIPADSVDLFASRGYTDIFGLSLTLRGAWAGAVTWATRAPGGWTPLQLQLLRDVMPALSAAMEPLAADLVTGVLLRTYLGRDPGNRVHRGAVQRGDGTTQRAVVWFSDIRGFTHYSNTLERDALLDLLNDGFEVAVAALEAEGGEVLKFMGDGLLAVFPEHDSDPTGSGICRAALRAALDLQARLSRLRTDRSHRGLAPIDMGVGLHWGDVSYGNIGAPARLDFTVIGPAVNLAARVESLCAQLGETLLATDAFVEHAGGGWTSRGRHRVKGVAEPVAVYSPTGPPTAASTGAVP